MKKRKKMVQRLLTTLLCLALCATDVIPAGMSVWAQEPEFLSEQEGFDTEGDTGVISDEGEAEKEAEASSEKEAEDVTEPATAEETDKEEAENPNQEADEPTENEPPVNGGDEEVTLPAAEEEESVSENAVEEDVVTEEELNVNAVMTTSTGEIASGKSNNISWVIDKNGKLTVSGSGDFKRVSMPYPEPSHSNATLYVAPWHDYRNSIKTAEVDVTDMTDASYMFVCCENLTSLDLSNFDTSSVTDMRCMFWGCSGLTSLNVSNFDTGNVTSMESMFADCSNLTSLDVSNFDTSKVAYMHGMFSCCSSLTTLDLSDFKTSSVTDMSCMFWLCSNLTSLDVGNFDTSSVTDMGGMFWNCSGLTSLDLSNFDTGSVTSMEVMFADCSNLTSLDLSSFDTGSVTYIHDMFLECSSLTSLDVSNFDTSKVTGMSGMFEDCSSLTSLDLSNFNTSSVTNMSRMFRNCYGLSSLDLSNFNTSSVTDMSRMFRNCSGLTSLDLSNFNTGSVTNMEYMFYSCSRLTTLDVNRFNTGSVTDMSGMFSYCSRLTSLNVSGFDTSNVTDMEEMFVCCQSLTMLDLSNFNTSSVTDMSGMFRNCSGLTSLDLSNFNTSNVTDMGHMFDQCQSLSTLDVSNFNTSNVTNMLGMFSCCFSLSTLDVSNFNTGSVTDMTNMFYVCENLTSLDLSSFDMQNVKSASCMLDCFSSLTCIYTPRNLSQTVTLYVDDEGKDKWYRSDDSTEVTELPKNLSHSIVITKNKKPDISMPRITAVKQKTAYVCGEQINTDDITVIYYSDKVTFEKITDTAKFTTNAAEINATMSEPGKKTLIVTYVDSSSSPSRELTDEIELTVTLALTTDSVEVALSGTTYTYNGRQQTPVPTVTLKDASKTELARWKDYVVSYKDNINAGTAVVVIRGMGVYSGTIEKTFTIDKAKVQIKVKDTTIAVGDVLPETFACEMTGFYNGDEERVTGVSFSFKDASGDPVTKEGIDTSKTGIYMVTPTAESVGANYEVDADVYQSGTLTIAEERVAYTVTFDMMGHGTQTPPIRSIRSGWLIEEPTAPTAEDYVFKGWYKDQACTKAWNFDVDMVQADTTLYARWGVQTAQGGIQIQEIPDQFYTGNAIKPVSAVYAADGTLLKAGKDYTVKYYNNVNVDQAAGDGGTSDKLTGNEQSVFNSKLPYVEIQGKGNHSGTVYRNFHIRPASIGTGGNAAAGFTLKYTDQLVASATKEQQPFSSLKYKKAMKAGTDYTVILTSSDVCDEKGHVIDWSKSGTTDAKNKYTLPVIPKGYSGVFEITVTGTGNYEGTITREIYVMAKADLIKNVTITLGKNQKNMPYSNGSAVSLTPGYYEASDKKYYKVNADGTINSTPEKNADGLFTVKNGKTYLVYGQDYTVTYTDNRAVGTATMTITGIGDYKGSKSATFKITGAAFKANTIEVKAYDQANPNDNDFRASMPYTGSAVTQNKVTLTTKVTNAKPDAKTLKYGEHYTITYKNNIKKGTATMTFTAKPESGYSGSFNKTFKIGAVSLTDTDSVKVEAVKTEAAESAGQDSLTPQKDTNGAVIGYKLGGTVTYSREGAKPSQRIRLSLIGKDGNAAGVVLKEGTDYAVSYANNTVVTANAAAGTQTKIPTMTFKGKGNYTGNLKVTFDISEAKMEAGGDNLTVTAAATAYDSKKASDYPYIPKITVKAGKKALSLNKDYTVDYQKCSQADVKAYLDALEAAEGGDGTGTSDTSNTAWEAVQAKRPYAVIKAVPGSGYTTTPGSEIKVYLDIYQTKLTGSNLYVVVSEEAVQTTYKGQQTVGSENQVKPSVTVYYSADAKAVSAAKKDKVTDETALTAASGTYRLTKLTPQTTPDGKGDYTLTYGANVTAGKNKGSVTVTGTGIYGGSVTTKFTILQRDVYKAP